MDGLALSAVVRELNNTMEAGRADKISQPEADELILSLRGQGVNRKLLLTANANAPRIHYTAQSKTSPLQAPMLTMVARKHLQGARFVGAVQPDFERIVELHFDSRSEMGDRSVKRLIIEIMGKHSNIILRQAYLPQHQLRKGGTARAQVRPPPRRRQDEPPAGQRGKLRCAV
jgi:predicted ribosome quality control (RQC) complex YloA/Tae2 family protein